MNDPEKSAKEAAIFIVQRLCDAGHVALFAGGCVRDRLLGNEPKDFDVATDATPDRVTALFPNARLVGAKFGVVLVRKYKHSIEVATFRSDGPYSDGRHPDRVTFGTDREDAARRDFTINGLYFDPVANEIIDYVGGQEDLRAGVIRTIGQPEQRFGEDHLRMLRAIRFAARLGFQIHPETVAAIRQHASSLRSISAERIWMELEAILAAPSRAIAWGLLIESGLRPHLAANWTEHAQRDALARSRLAALPTRTVDVALALAATLRDYTSDEINLITADFKLSNKLSEGTTWLVSSLNQAIANPEMELADLKGLMVDGEWSNLLRLLDAETTLQPPLIATSKRIRKRANEVAPDQIAPPPFVTGYDLGELGLKPGPRLGEILKSLYRAQLNEQLLDKDQAIQMAKSLV